MKTFRAALSLFLLFVSLEIKAFSLQEQIVKPKCRPTLYCSALQNNQDLLEEIARGGQEPKRTRATFHGIVKNYCDIMIPAAQKKVSKDLSEIPLPADITAIILDYFDADIKCDGILNLLLEHSEEERGAKNKPTLLKTCCVL